MSEIKVYKDEVAEKLDELADLCEYWKKQRQKGFTSNGIRVGVMMVISEINLITEAESKNAPLK